MFKDLDRITNGPKFFSKLAKKYVDTVRHNFEQIVIHAITICGI